MGSLLPSVQIKTGHAFNFLKHCVPFFLFPIPSPFLSTSLQSAFTSVFYAVWSFFFVWQTPSVPETIKNTSLKIVACSGSQVFSGWPSKLGILMPEDSRCWVELTPDATHSLVCCVLLV